MTDSTLEQRQQALLSLLPADCTTVGNQTLLAQFTEARRQAGDAVGEAEFSAAREALLAAGLIVKGRGRGGATARATGPVRPDFDLSAPAITPDLLATDKPIPAKSAQVKTAQTAKATKASKAAPASPQAEPQVISYRHPDRRRNNPEVGLVNTQTDPEQPRTRWAYDPHLDPALQFDSARAQAEAM
ncbi:MAG: hypothetical protein ACMV1D_06100, partial [Macromonas sp.]